MHAPSATPNDEARQIVQGLRRTLEAFTELFAAESDETLHHRAGDGWSAIEVVGHLADHDRFEREQRFEAVLSGDVPRLPDDETRFEVARSDYQALSKVDALDFFSRERELVVELLDSLDPGDWKRTGIHPNDGEVTLLELADLRGHDREHYDQAVAAIVAARK